jgi:hypothetical protein
MDPVTLGVIGVGVVGAKTLSTSDPDVPTDADPVSADQAPSPSEQTPMSGGGMYSLAYWTPTIQRLLEGEYPELAARDGALAFVVAWMSFESGGNPCAIGVLGQTSADGSNNLPRELGLGQLYNPDDCRTAGIDPSTLRAYSSGYAGNPSLVRGTAEYAADRKRAESVARALTSEEEEDQVRYTLLWKIQQCATKADSIGVSWATSDWWKLVKAPHALPGILNQGMPAVISQLGRAPVDWAEFRQQLGMDGNATWKSALNACEKCANATV